MSAAQVLSAPRRAIKALRGVKDTPPYLHDGRLLTLDDTVEFFGVILQVPLSPPEKRDLVAFVRAL